MFKEVIMVYHVVVLFYEKGLQSITINGDELETISAIQDKQIADWLTRRMLRAVGVG